MRVGEIIGRREPPCPLSIKEKRKIPDMIIPVVRYNIEDHLSKKPVDIFPVPGKGSSDL